MATNYYKLPKAWRDAIDAEITSADANERPAIAAAFREAEAKYLLEIVIPQMPGRLYHDEIGESYADFSEGWQAAMRFIGHE